MSPQRKERLAREEAIQNRFAAGHELKNLRSDVEHLRENMKWAEAMNDETRMKDLTQAIKKRESRDPDRVYTKTLMVLAQLQRVALTKMPDKEALKERWTKMAMEARSCLPRFQLEGLWIGSYGDHGYEMINVTYSGDTLIATKVTGDKNVLRGSVSFRANLSPLNQSSSKLPQISLPSQSASKWGVDKLSRYIGEGQIAKDGNTDSKFVDGQLVMFENHFSFVWLPTRHHVIFGRPSPEVTLRMLRDTISKEDEVENMREHLERCMDMDITTCITRVRCQKQKTAFRRIAREKELEELEKKVRAKVQVAIGFADVFNLKKWRTYIDEVLNAGGKRADTSN